MTSNNCPFCERSVREKGFWHTTYWFALYDAYPVVPMHTLLIPYRHVSKWRELVEDEKLELLSLINTVEPPTDYNLGLNDGPLAGQTVSHLHVHIIPRHKGDVPDPRGGVRWVIPHKAKYWDD